MDEYEILDKIGDGSFGQVYLCKRRVKQNREKSSKSLSSILESSKTKGKIKDKTKNGQQLVAVKKMNKKYLNWDECVHSREIVALKRLHHVNLIQLLEVIREDNTLYLVFEHMDQNLNQLIQQRTTPFPEITIKRITFQLLCGLAYIHSHGFFHRDIKPENLLCNGPNMIKIADFGLTRELNSAPPYTEYVSTRWYRAPELLLRARYYSAAVDIWATGCIIGELYTLQPMFPGRSEIDQLFKICLALGSPNMESWPEGRRLSSKIQFKYPLSMQTNLQNLLPSCSKIGFNLIESIFSWIPEERPKAEEILDHEFLRFIDSSESNKS